MVAHSSFLCATTAMRYWLHWWGNVSTVGGKSLSACIIFWKRKSVEGLAVAFSLHLRNNQQHKQKWQNNLCLSFDFFKKNNNIARVFLKKQPKLPSISIVSGSACCCFSPQFHTQNFILFRASQRKVTNRMLLKGRAPRICLFHLWVLTNGSTYQEQRF